MLNSGMPELQTKGDIRYVVETLGLELAPGRDPTKITKKKEKMEKRSRKNERRIKFSRNQ